MLWYKAWRETRIVTLGGVAAMAIACGMIVWFEHAMRDNAEVPMSYVAYIWKSVYNSIGRDIFLFLCVILGGGGLLQERAQGTAGFTLSLPASRGQIVFWRAVMGYAGVVALALTPAVVLPLASPYRNEIYPVSQALGFSLLWAGCGAVFYGFTFLLAHVLEGEYTAILAAIPSLMFYGVLQGLPWMERLPMLNIFHVVNGEDMPYFNEGLHLLTGPLPWLPLGAMLVLASGFVFAAGRRMRLRDF